MPRKAEELTALAVSKLGRGFHAVGGVPGLYLQVENDKSRSWILRAMINGRRRDMGLGSFDAVGLAAARKAATAARNEISDPKTPKDPIEERKAARRAALAAAARSITFRQAAEAYIASKREGWRNAKHADQWPSTLKAYAYPIVGKLPIGEIDNAAVLRVLQQDVSTGNGTEVERLWTAKPETASRLRGRLEAVIGWAIAGGQRVGDNPARWDLLKHQLPAKTSLPKGKVKHHTALPIDEVPAFMERLRAADGMGARALEFTILSAARSGETRGATWAEIDLEAKTWTIPGGRMKAGKEHRIPLAPAAIDLLNAIPKMGGADLVFPAPRGGMLSDMTLTAVLRRLQVPVTAHGFRSTFRDWVSERTGFGRDLAELALAHAVGDKVELAYRRGDQFEKRRRLAEAWAKFCAAPLAAKADNVRTLRRRV